VKVAQGKARPASSGAEPPPWVATTPIPIPFFQRLGGRASGPAIQTLKKGVVHLRFLTQGGSRLGGIALGYYHIVPTGLD
jgi:hypothetical protein